MDLDGTTIGPLLEKELGWSYELASACAQKLDRELAYLRSRTAEL